MLPGYAILGQPALARPTRDGCEESDAPLRFSRSCMARDTGGGSSRRRRDAEDDVIARLSRRGSARCRSASGALAVLGDVQARVADRAQARGRQHVTATRRSALRPTSRGPAPREHQLKPTALLTAEGSFCAQAAGFLFAPRARAAIRKVPATRNLTPLLKNSLTNSYPHSDTAVRRCFRLCETNFL